MIKPGMFISDRYEIIDKVGTGGMADVYKARCHRLNRFVAIKILKPEFSDDKNFVMKFRAEAQSAAGLSHPNIVNVYDVGEDDGLYYIVMELVEGITLKNFIERKGKLEVKEAVGIAIQIAQGMEAAHDNHIIHRDIKPQNIIISREGKVKVTDFGIAKATTSNTVTSTAMGSVHYISPEQARGGYSDEKSDIYSLGITIYEMLSGKVPYEGESAVAIALAHIQNEAVPLRQIEPSIPISLEQIVQKCMQKKPERRYLCAADLIADLKRAIMSPNENFVKLAPAMDDSPTINLSAEEVNAIKDGAKTTGEQQQYDSPTTKATRIVDEKEEIRGKGRNERFYKTQEEEEEEEDDDDEDDEEVDPKLEKLMMGGGIAAAVILAIIVIVLIGKFTGLFSFRNNSDAQESELPTETPIVSIKPSEDPEEDKKEEEEKEEELVIPGVIGSSYEEAYRILTEKGFVVQKEEMTSELYAEGKVANQVPSENTKAKQGDTVVLYVSAIKVKTTTVPDVYGKSTDTAIAEIKAANLVVKPVVEEFHDTVAAGEVIRTSPEKNATVEEGASVTIYVSKGKEVKTVKVPSVTDMTEAKALQVLEDSGLEGVVTNYVHDDDVAEGLVIAQDTSWGQSVVEGTTIGLTVSLGPEPAEETPTPEPKVYIGYYEIDSAYSPFDTEEETGRIVLKMTKDGTTTTIFDGVVSNEDFPLSDAVFGNTDSQGTIKMYLDNEDCGVSVAINFEEVAD